ncbi:MAG: ubiquitin-like small modifier protein 1 [Haloarculaceae archaeon]
MEIELRFFANFRATVGQKTLNREFEDVSTVGELARALSEEYPEMELFDGEGSLREFIRVMKNGKDITHLDGLETELEDGDTISIFPPVAGG